MLSATQPPRCSLASKVDSPLDERAETRCLSSSLAGINVLRPIIDSSDGQATECRHHPGSSQFGFDPTYPPRIRHSRFDAGDRCRTLIFWCRTMGRAKSTSFIVVPESTLPVPMVGSIPLIDLDLDRQRYTPRLANTNL
jgi:hypothetical protein